MSLEAEFVDWLKEQVGRHEALCVGIGDDGAVVHWGDADKHGGEAVVVADLLAEGTHFVLDVLGPRRVGRKALAVNLSDLAAMAAIPVAATVSVLLPRMNAQWIARELFEGLLPLAREFDVAIAGGDTNTWNGPLVIDVTAWGRLTPSGPLLRSAAQVGDRILVTGRLGGSILGRHADFQPRIDEALALRTEYGIAAGMDISDGLALDLSRLATASGVGAILDVDHVPVHDDAHRLSADTSQGPSALQRALADGEDFELLVTAPPDVAATLTARSPFAVPLTDVGEIVAAAGLSERRGDGSLRPLNPTGYLHEAEDRTP
ncbi:MAG: thiamine-monophosphate kinase [Planctomycetales bacterium]|nr:thiamine-monophosphate kinase [Planctomycetales bacterium]